MRILTDAEIKAMNEELENTPEYQEWLNELEEQHLAQRMLLDMKYARDMDEGLL